MRAEPGASLQWGLFPWQASWIQAQPSSGLGIFRSQNYPAVFKLCVLCVSVCRRHLAFKPCVCVFVCLSVSDTTRFSPPGFRCAAICYIYLCFLFSCKI